MAPPDGVYYIQTPEGNHLTLPDKMGELVIAPPKPMDADSQLASS
jgi:hypothetical protein